MLLPLVLTASFAPTQLPDSRQQKDMEAHKFWQTQPVTRFGMTFLYLVQQQVDIAEDIHRLLWFQSLIVRFSPDDDKDEVKEGPISPPDPSKVPKQPYALIDGFEWVTMNLDDEQEVSVLPARSWSQSRTLFMTERMRSRA